MLLHDPANALAHEGPQYGGDHVAVGVGRKGVADVMEQRRRHVLLVLAGAVEPAWPTAGSAQAG